MCCRLNRINSVSAYDGLCYITSNITYAPFVSFRLTGYQSLAETVEQGNKIKYKTTNIVLYVDTLKFRKSANSVFNEIRILLGNQS